MILSIDEGDGDISEDAYRRKRGDERALLLMIVDGERVKIV